MIRNVDHAELSKLDLNNLVALDALLETQSVTGAAGAMHVTQSAMSHTLKRLRQTLGDPLLVRSGHKMLATPVAQALRLPLRTALLQLQQTFTSPGEFDPVTTERTFSLATSDYVSLTLMPTFCQRFRERAPRANLVVMSGARTDVETLAAGSVDVVLAPMSSGTASGLMARKLYEERFVAVVRDDHPDVSGTLDLDTYIDLAHLLISPTGKGPGRVDEVLAELGHTRRIAMRTGHFGSAIAIVAASDLILSCPMRLANAAQGHAGIRLLELPIQISGFDISAIWHERFTADPASRWLRAMLAAAGTAV